MLRQRNIFSLTDKEAYLREEFLKQSIGNSSTYVLNSENAMSGEFNAMIVQSIET